MSRPIITIRLLIKGNSADAATALKARALRFDATHVDDLRDSSLWEISYDAEAKFDQSLAAYEWMGEPSSMPAKAGTLLYFHVVANPAA